ncbi:MAG: helix-turn-helix transcriptional regulator [Candidatus Saganbacteria bacterium]|nr:helix-turn-helix transcriptional regulator [Candidatus Saganbacteria bacterium]
MVKHPAIMWCMNKTIGIELGKKIKEFRRKRGITQEQLAELTETSYKYIQRIEGKTPPDVRLTTITRIAKALKVKPAELLKF